MTDGVGFTRAVFNETRAIVAFRNVPRFGHSNDFVNLVQTHEESVDYTLGLLFAGVLLATLFVTWTFLLAIFRCIGPRRLGFWAGGKFVAHGCGPQVARIIFMISALALLIFSILFVTEGLTDLRNTVTTTIDSADNIHDTMEEVDRISNELEGLAINSVDFRKQLINSLDGGGLNCLTNVSANSNTGFPIESIVKDLRQGLIKLGNFTFDTDSVQSTTQLIMKTTEDVKVTAESIDFGDWQALVILIPYTIIPMFLTIGVIIAWMKIDLPQYRCFLSYVLLPIFLLMIIFAYFFSSTILVAATANSDFCSGENTTGPDDTVLEILKEKEFDEKPFAYQVAEYYIRQCVTDDPFIFINKYANEIQTIRANITLFADIVNDAVNTATKEICGDDFDTMSNLAVNLSDELKTLLRISVEILTLLQCDNVVPLYTLPVYDGICKYAISGVTWAFAAFTVVGVVGLLMITLRSSWQIDLDTALVFDGTSYATGKEAGADEDEVEYADYAYNDDTTQEESPQQQQPQRNTDGNMNSHADASTTADDPLDDDASWLQSEFTVPDDVRLDDPPTQVSTNSKPQTYATPYG